MELREKPEVAPEGEAVLEGRPLVVVVGAAAGALPVSVTPLQSQGFLPASGGGGMLVLGQCCCIASAISVIVCISGWTNPMPSSRILTRSW